MRLSRTVAPELALSWCHSLILTQSVHKKSDFVIRADSAKRMNVWSEEGKEKAYYRERNESLEKRMDGRWIEQ